MEVVIIPLLILADMNQMWERKWPVPQFL